MHMGSWLDVHRRGSKRVAMVRHNRKITLFFSIRDDVQIWDFTSRRVLYDFTSDRLEKIEGVGYQ